MSKKPTYEQLEQKIKKLENELESSKNKYRILARDRKQTEQALKARESFLNNVIDQSPFATWISDAGGTMQHANPALKKFLNLTDEQLIGKYNVFKDSHVKKQGLMPLIRTVYEQGKTINFTCDWDGNDISTMDLKGSNSVSIEAAMFPIFDSKGKLTNVVLNWIDVTDRKRAENGLLERDAQLRTLIETLPDLVWLKDPDGVYITCNPKFERFFGAEESEIRGKTDYDFVDKKLADFFRENDKIALENNRPTINEEEVIFADDGHRELLETIKTPMYDSVGKLVGVLGIARDITERKQMEEDIARNEALFRGLFDHMTSGAAIYEVINDGSTGSDYIFKGFNRKSLEHEGKPLDQVIGKTLLELRPNIDDFGLIPVLKKVWETGKSAYHPIKIYQDEKFSNYYENYVFKIPSGEVVAIYNDVTEQKKAEAELKESKERFELAMRFANDGLYDWNLETNRVYYSSGWKKMLGYRDDEITNTFSEWERLTRPEDVKDTLKMINELLEKKREGFEKEFRMRHKDGHWVHILSRGNVVTDEQGKPIKIIGTHVDLTERKQFESRLRQAQKMESIGTLAGGIAHDFNNILGIILGNTELALDDVPEWNPATHNLQEVVKASLRAKDVIRQLLSFSRGSEPTKKPVAIGPIIKESLRFMRSSLPVTIEIRMNIPGQVDTILADPTQIHQIIINLCTNASHAMEENGGILEINLTNLVLDNESSLQYPDSTPGNYVCLSINDTGSGILPEIKERIFDPYFTTKGVGKGSGMGLAVVHGIVKNHNGSISVYSEPGKGTCFKILIPAVEQPVETQLGKNINPVKGSGNILLVDDEKAILDMGRQMLERLGYRVIVQSNPLEALNLYKSRPNMFDLIITDMTMPQMTGDKLSKEILKIRPDMPIILCTGFSEKINKEYASQIGIRKYIEKPLNKRELSIALQEVLFE